jgi:deoxyribonuclease-4
MKIGAHVSTAGGINKAVGRGVEIGCETIQIFGSSPQAWAFKPIPGEEVEAFRQNAAEAGIGPVFLHAIYLVNLGTSKPDLLEKGIESLVHYMSLASDIGASGVIFHPGSHGGAGYEAIYPQTVSAIQRVLGRSPENSTLVLENMAGMGWHIGAKFGELGRILEGVGSPRLRVCLDTQHCFAAGYDLTTSEGIEAMIAEFDQDVGAANLVAVHANDSKRVCGSGVDRHDNIGEGFIGEEGFAAIMANPAFREMPFLLEVPGFEGKGPDRQNIDILKSIRRRLESDR